MSGLLQSAPWNFDRTLPKPSGFYEHHSEEDLSLVSMCRVVVPTMAFQHPHVVARRLEACCRGNGHSALTQKGAACLLKLWPACNEAFKRTTPREVQLNESCQVHGYAPWQLRERIMNPIETFVRAMLDSERKKVELPCDVNVSGYITRGSLNRLIVHTIN